MKVLHMVCWILVIVGALNWGLVGVGEFAGSNWNVVNLVLGSWPTIEAILYVLIGLAAVYELVMHRSTCNKCAPQKSAAPTMAM